MPVVIQCPTCQCQLSVPGAAPGQVLACSQCGNQFLVPAPVAAPLATPLAAPRVVIPAPLPALDARGRASIAAAMLPPTGAPVPPLNPGAVAANASGVVVGPPIVTPVPSAPLVAPPPVADSAAAGKPTERGASGAVPPAVPPMSRSGTGAAIPAPPVATAARVSQSAKFIAADATAARFDLTAEGKLPELVLADRVAATPAERTPAHGPPWLLVGLLLLSISSSVVMLVFDSDGSTEGRTSQVAARDSIRQFYLGQPPHLEPYQTQLRLALQAGQRGDRAEEKRHCQDVLTLLRSEGTSRFRGLTGMAASDVDPPAGPPNDRHLERLISVLLSDD